jgi:anti-anti-sigma factor
MSLLQIESVKKNDILYLRFEGEIGLSEEHKFRQHVEEALKNNHPFLVIDLRKITLLSSYGIAAVMGLWKRQNASGGRACIVCNKNHVFDCLSVVGVDRLVSIFENEEEAEKYFKGE